MADKAKHTPGPWEYGGGFGRNRGYILGGLMTPGEPQGIKQIAVVAQDRSLAGGDPKANGHLLAAAPDLLAALRLYEAALAAVLDPDPSAEASARAGVLVAKAQDAGRAALARAEGKGPAAKD
jgi:hypothetical protein